MYSQKSTKYDCKLFCLSVILSSTCVKAVTFVLKTTMTKMKRICRPKFYLFIFLAKIRGARPPPLILAKIMDPLDPKIGSPRSATSFKPGFAEFSRMSLDVQVQPPNQPATLNKSNYGQSRTKSQFVFILPT